MKRKRFWLIKPINILLMVLSILMCVALFFTDRTLFYIFTPIVVLGVVYSAYKLFKIQQDLYKTITTMGRAMTDSQEASLINFPLPSLIVSDVGEIIWYNDMFRERVLPGGEDIFGYQLYDMISEEVTDLIANQGKLVTFFDRFYEVYCLKTVSESVPLYLLYLVDITELEQIRLKSERTQPAVLLLLIDNYDEVLDRESESNRERLLGEVRTKIREFVGEGTGFMRRLGGDRYVVVMEKQDLDAAIKSRFHILDQVREIRTDTGAVLTLSIGAALVEDTFANAEQNARQALDMALGRGGDQAAVKSENGYDFFGGYSQGIEKRTKVKTRIVASALTELIRNADNVLLMGHRFADLDALGSAIGMASACRAFGKQTHIVLDSQHNLADVLVKRLIEADLQNLLCPPENALDLITEKTLLIVLDTHIETLLESSEVYHRCGQVVVIDHHRKMVNHITDAVIFYHEPYASSASEMVTELIQYFGDQCRIGKLEAEALMSGIMLDTKNFILKTGVRTFEAAAYLRRMGADTVEVRQLFSSTIDSYQRRSRIVSAAQIYHECAVAVCDFYSDDMRIVAPQAADELLGISGVKASFVLYESHGSVNISARSMGAVNVQILMEKMGGGGHQSMAGAQIADSDVERVQQMLFEVIDEQRELRENNAKEG